MHHRAQTGCVRGLCVFSGLECSGKRQLGFEPRCNELFAQPIYG